MGLIKFLRGTMSAIPEAITDGYIYLAKNTGALFFDVGTKRVRANPPSDWEETNSQSPAYISNKPELGTVASHDITSTINQTEDIPISKAVYDELREHDRELAQLTDNISSGGPVIVNAVEEMIDDGRVYVYVRDEGEEVESGMQNWHKYYYRDGVLKDGGVYDSAVVNTDTTLLLAGRAADAAATGDRISELQGTTEDIYNKLTSLTEDVETLQTESESYVDALEVTADGLVYVLHNGIRVDGPYGPFAGNGSGGGGGGSSYDQIDAVFTATNTTEWSSPTVSYGTDLYFTFNWSSTENDVPSGRGTVTITVNNVTKATLSVQQGDVSINLRPYYNAGANKIRIRIADQYDQGKSWIANVNAVEFTISSTFDTSQPFQGLISFPYSLTGGNLEKTIHFLIDNVEIGTKVDSSSNQVKSYIIPTQSHGSHSLDVYFEADVNGEIVKSNTLHYEFIFVTEGSNEVIITSSFNTLNWKQYSSIIIPYYVYDPQSLEPEVKIYVNDVLVLTQTVDRLQQSYTYKASHEGNYTIKIDAGPYSTPKEIPLVIEKSDVEIQAEIDQMALYLTSYGRSNGESAKNTWTYENIECEFTNFGWVLDGWTQDSDGIVALRLLGDSRLYIPYKPFSTNFINSGKLGKTIEIEFATHNVIDYTATIGSCYVDGIGFQLTPQSITVNGSQTELMYPFKDNEHIRVSIVINSVDYYRLMQFYVNGIMSAAIQYSSTENFSQSTANATGISFGSNLCGIDIYNIRIYDKAFTREEVVNNWIADTQDGDEMIDRFNRNNIFDGGVINPNTLPSNMPYWILNVPELPQYKGDKKTITLEFTDPVSPSKSFTASGVQINVQGTSSQAYYRKNYDLQFKKGFNMNTGYAENYTIINAVPYNRFVLKADVASSESANNTLLSMFYSDTSPYKTPEMLADSRVRMGIEGRPCVVFWNNTDTGELEFLGR